MAGRILKPPHPGAPKGPPTLPLQGRVKARQPLRDGDNFRPFQDVPYRQASDPLCLSALLTESGAPTYPHPPRLLHPCPTFCPVEASSGGADDGAEGRFPCAAASPVRHAGASPGHPPLRALRRHCAGGDRCARSIARRARGTGAAGQPAASDGTGAISPCVPQRPRFPTGAVIPRSPPPGRRGKVLTGHPVSCPLAPEARTRMTINAAVKRREARRLACRRFQLARIKHPGWNWRHRLDASRRASAIRSPVPRGTPRGTTGGGVPPPRLTALHPSCLSQGRPGTEGSSPGLSGAGTRGRVSMRHAGRCRFPLPPLAVGRGRGWGAFRTPAEPCRVPVGSRPRSSRRRRRPPP
jgi:hypothetical protein